MHAHLPFLECPFRRNKGDALIWTTPTNLGRHRISFRYNIKTRQVEIRAPPPAKASGSKPEATGDDAATLQKAADFVRAFICGFEVDDALALLRLDDLFLDSFQVLQGDATMISCSTHSLKVNSGKILSVLVEHHQVH